MSGGLFHFQVYFPTYRNLMVPEFPTSREENMERYIHNENIRRYRKLLELEQDEEKRSVIRKLLAEERRVGRPERSHTSQSIRRGQRPRQLAALLMRKPRHQASLLPNLNIFSINELSCFFGGILIVRALYYFRRLIDLAIGINKVDAVDWHSRIPQRRERYTLSHR